MKVVAYAELVIMLRVTFGAILFWNSLLSPIIYAHFLRQRYYQSLFTREALAATAAFLDTKIIGLQNPTVTNIWDKSKLLVQRWAGRAPAA